MNERQKRLIEVYDHVRKFYGIHTKTDFAEAVHYGRTSMSAALNGNEKYLTDSLFNNICHAWPGTFNLEYLLTGEGGLLTIEETVSNEEFLKLINAQMLMDKIERPGGASNLQTDESTIVKVYEVALQAKTETVESLKREIKTKDELIFDLRARLAEKDAKIASLEAQLKKLESERLPDQDSLTEITIPHIVKNHHPHPVESPE